MHWTQDPIKKAKGLEARKQTNLKKYGSISASGNEEIKKKVRDKLKKIIPNCPDPELYILMISERCNRNHLDQIFPPDWDFYVAWNKQYNISFCSKYTKKN